VKLKSSYDDHSKASNETGLKCADKSLAQQHMLQETDINWMMKRYTQTGEIPQLTMPPMQGDFTDAPDFQTAMNLIVAANNAFAQQPAEIRARFGNDPAAFVDFCSNEANRDDMRKMGLFSPEAVKAFELQAQTEKDLREANRRDAEAHRAARKGGKGDTQEGVT